MNKLTALSKLASAYHTLVDSAPVSTTGASAGDSEALTELLQKFNWIRRSLRIDDQKPQPKSVEGINGKGPTFF